MAYLYEKARMRGTVVHVDTSTGLRRYLTLLAAKDVMKKGRPPELIIGEVNTESNTSDSSPELTLKSIKVNPLFQQTLFISCETVIPTLPEFQTQVTHQKHGRIYLVDQRTKEPTGSVPPEDIIAAFEVNHGQVVSFRLNNSHKLITNLGLFDLGENANRAFEEYLTKRLASSQ